MSASGTDTISSGDEPERLPRRVRRPAAPTPGARTTALTAALSLVLAGGVATAAYRTSTDAADPTTLVPASAFAVATLDLGAPGDALGDFADHFPGSPTHHGDGSAKDRLFRQMFADPDFTYDDDIKPWLGDHVAFAGWLDDGEPRLQVLMESRDDDAARKFLTGPGSGDDQAFVIRSHYVVMGDTEEIVSKSLAAAGRSALADNETYTADVAALPADEAVVGWLDGPGAKKALASAMGGFGSPDDMFGQMPFFTMTGDPFTQRVAVGLHMTDDYVQADMRTYGSPATKATAPSSVVTGLPSGTIGALALAGADTYVDTMFGFVRDFAGIAEPPMTCFSGGVVGEVPTPGVVPTPTRVPDAHLSARERRQLLRELRRQHPELPAITPAPDTSCTPSEPVDPIEEMERATGLSLPGDVKTLLGDRMVIAFGGMNLTGPPDIAIRSHPDDVDEARPIAETLAAALTASSGFGLFVETPDDELVVGTTSAYAKLVAGDGDLGDDDAFIAAMGEVPDEISSAGFLDLTRIWPLIEAQGDDVGDAKHLHGIGMWTATEGDVQVAQMRLTAG